MKQKIVALVLLIFMLAIMAVPAFADVVYYPDPWIVDRAELLTQQEESKLSQVLSQLSKTYQTQILIFTIPSAKGTDLDTYINAVYDDNQLGYGNDRSGILLLVCMDPGEFRILTNGTAHDAIGSWEIEKICDVIVSDMSDGCYADAFDQFADQCAYYLDGHINGFPFDATNNLLIAVIIGLVVGLITALALKAQLKSVRRQNQADVYVKQGSMDVTVRRDLFLYRHVTRVRKETNSSSGSRSGGSRSVGGRSF